MKPGRRGRFPPKWILALCFVIVILNIPLMRHNDKEMIMISENQKNSLFSYSDKVSFQQSNNHSIAGLNCELFGGPSNDLAEEMIYWSDIPKDSNVLSPFYDEDKYLTFEPDHGGWNNIRMSMETVLVLAHAMGRTLVLPPEQKMYLLGKSDNSQKKHFSFHDFFHLDSIHNEHKGINIITMEEFLKLQQEPPMGTVNWNGKELNPLYQYLRKLGHVRTDWDPSECTAAIPASKDPNDILELKQIMNEINMENVQPEDFKGKPFPVNDTVKNRLKENSSSRKKLCIYDEEMQNAPHIHFQTGKHETNPKKLRLLTHFYSFVFFQDWKQDLWAKRFVRDHVRYIDEIICAAARVVNAVREKAKLNQNMDPERMLEGKYDAFHVRRGDFQYKKTRLEAEELLKRSKTKLKKGTTLYIATDERDKNFFAPLKEYYEIYFLDDFKHLLTGINTNYYGMIDQLVAYKSDTFIGTWWSTLSGYVNRLRGYYSVKAHLDGYQNGTLKSWYFVPDERVDEMQIYWPVRLPLYMREFPTSWRDIDKDIDAM